MEPTRQRALALVIAALAVVALASHRAPPAPPEPRSPRRAVHAPAPLAAAALRDGRPLDLNRATAADLELLPHVGPALAGRIVAARAARGGAYAAVDDLDAVPGIGEKTLARIRPYLIVPNPPLAPVPPVR